MLETDSKPMSKAKFKAWHSVYFQTCDRRAFDLQIDDLIQADPGSPTDIPWRHKMCKTLVSHLDPKGPGMHWSRLLEEKYPYLTPRGRGLDSYVKQKAIDLKLANSAVHGIHFEDQASDGVHDDTPPKKTSGS